VLKNSSADRILTEYASYLFKNGGTVSELEKTYAAYLFLRAPAGCKGPALFPRFLRALNGFRKLEPPVTRPPIPWSHVCLMARTALRLREVAVALYWVCTFALYLRPYDGLKIRKKELMQPSGSSRYFAINMFSVETFVRSKTGLSDVSLILDCRVCPWLGQALAANSRRSAGTMLFNLSPAHLLKTWKQCLSTSGLDELEYEQYQLRHGGPSHDRLHDFRTLAEIKARGTWLADSSLKRYECAARIQYQESLPSRHVKRAAVEAAARLPTELCTALGVSAKTRL